MPAKKPTKSTDDMTLDERLAGLDQTGTPSLPPKDVQLPEQSAAPGEDRPMPSYKGIDGGGTDAGHALIWIPRVVFFPVHLVFEYLIRWPIVTGITLLEEYYIFKRIERILTWRDGKSGIFPTFFADFGLRPAVGLTTFHNDIFFNGNNFNAGASTWGPKWLNIFVNNQTLVLDEDTGQIIIGGFFDTRPDQPFYGVGPQTSTDDRVRFRWQRYQAHGEFFASLGGLSNMRVGTAFRHVDFLDDALAPALDPALLPDLVGDGALSYEIVESRLQFKLDTRDPDTEFKGGSGFLLEGFGTFAFDFTDTSRNYLRWGGETAVFLDFTGRGHVLAARVYAEFVEDTGGSPIPFTELPALGGIETMRGYLQRRFVGDSVFMAGLSYRYPIWSLLDAEVFGELGNAFNGRLNGFKPDRLYLATGGGIRTSIDRDTALTLLVAVGTNRLDSDDLEVDSVRITFGVVQGF